MSRWELGSEFHWMGLPPAPRLPWPRPARWYLLGRHAITALLDHLAKTRPRVWLPSYFCHEVLACSRMQCEVLEYRDDPRWPEPEWSSLFPKPTDIVVAVNYFGVRSGEVWRNWRNKNPCVLLEDHTHDPHSNWALQSTAEYAFCSLRKTLPVPDGCVLWSPTGLDLPTAPSVGDWSGSALKLAAMFHKAEYLSGHGGAGDALKTLFRSQQLEGERRLTTAAVSTITPYTHAYLAAGSPESWRRQRLGNALRLIRSLDNWKGGNLLFHIWPAGHVPFCVLAVFASERERDECRTVLHTHNVFCPVHWECQTSDPDALDLSSRVLSLCVDQRYTEQDMDRVAELLR